MVTIVACGAEVVRFLSVPRLDFSSASLAGDSLAKFLTSFGDPVGVIGRFEVDDALRMEEDPCSLGRLNLLDFSVE